eukprot:TRINITY_DN57881_c0_g1_i1.p1 TRINITY_DN57881_c0_g1~~TRINITY_DN57881_c0_g1_i1.p1  ORF type:complete len:157 (-),score=35.88 TRINITY_DN57881_c0_g1_i1:44-514(-)
MKTGSSGSKLGLRNGFFFDIDVTNSFEGRFAAPVLLRIVQVVAAIDFILSFRLVLLQTTIGRLLSFILSFSGLVGTYSFRRNFLLMFLVQSILGGGRGLLHLVRHFVAPTGTITFLPSFLLVLMEASRIFPVVITLWFYRLLPPEEKVEKRLKQRN